MIEQFKQVDVIPWSFMQVWNSNDPNQAKYLDPKGIGSSWHGTLHFSDLYGDLRSPTHADETQTCNTLGTAACAAAQLNSQTGQKELFQYLENRWVGGRGSFNAFINSNKFNNAKRILAIGGANTEMNHSVSDYTFRAIFKDNSVFLNSLQKWVQAYPNIKGVDYDFEPPLTSSGGQVTPDEGTIEDYKKLMALVKNTKTTMGNNFHVSVTITTNIDYLNKIKDAVDNPSEGNWFEQLYNVVDELNIMTYDLHGPWGQSGDPRTSIHSALLQVDNVPGKENFAIQYGGIKAINTVLNAGFGADKLQMGIAQYGRAFGGVEDNGGMENLPGYNATWTHAATIDEMGKTNTNSDGFVPYKSIQKMTQQDGYLQKNVIDPDTLRTVGGYIYNPNTKVFIGYESPEEVVSACNLIKEKGLKGAIMWSIDTDLPVSNPASLIATYRNAGC